MHAALTGERRGYYADFGGMAPIAKALQDRFVFEGGYSAYRRRRHGARATDLSSEHFIFCLQNHDQVGNRATGDRLSTLLSPAQLRLAAAILLLAPYVPMLFMGEEYGETSPFLYFVSHADQRLVEAVRRGRREEFAAFGWSEAVPDPFEVETFRRSTLDRTLSAVGWHAGLRALHRDLLRLRREERALVPGGSRIHTAFDAREEYVTMELVPERGAPLLGVFNFSAEPRQATVDTVSGGEWLLRLSTEAERYGGGCTSPERLLSDGEGSTRVPVPGHAAVLYRRDA